MCASARSHSRTEFILDCEAPGTGGLREGGKERLVPQRVLLRSRQPAAARGLLAGRLGELGGHDGGQVRFNLQAIR